MRGSHYCSVFRSMSSAISRFSVSFECDQSQKQQQASGTFSNLRPKQKSKKRQRRKFCSNACTCHKRKNPHAFNGKQRFVMCPPDFDFASRFEGTMTHIVNKRLSILLEDPEGQVRHAVCIMLPKLCRVCHECIVYALWVCIPFICVCVNFMLMRIHRE